MSQVCSGNCFVALSRVGNCFFMHIIFSLKHETFPGLSSQYLEIHLSQCEYYPYNEKTPLSTGVLRKLGTYVLYVL